MHFWQAVACPAQRDSQLVSGTQKQRHLVLWGRCSGEGRPAPMVDARTGIANGRTVRLSLRPPGSVRGKVTVSVRQRCCSRSCRGGMVADDQAANGPEACSRTGTVTLGAWSARVADQAAAREREPWQARCSRLKALPPQHTGPILKLALPFCSGRAVEGGRREKQGKLGKCREE